MYLPSAFADPDPDRCRALIAAHPVATVVVNGPDGAPPDAQHVPLLWLAPVPAPGENAAAPRLLGHVARVNALAEVPAGTPVLAVFHGPEHPISPAWYATKATDPRVVPTWNYATVHAAGRLTVHADEARVRDALIHLTNATEPALGSPWRLADAPDAFVARLCQAVVAIEIEIDRLQGKWKLSQNRPDADRASVVAALEARAASRGTDHDPAAVMARLVRYPHGGPAR